MRMINAIVLPSVSALAFATATQAQTALGQSEPAQVAVRSAAVGSNDIIVTARRRDESLQNVPQTVNVVTADQVDKLNLRNSTDIESIVPGLYTKVH